MTENLYGIKQASKTKAKDFSSSTSQAFSSNLASLISSSTSKATNGGRARQLKNKSDIFTAHNKNVKKRAAKDLEEDGGQKHKTEDEIGTASAADLHRSKRRMEEKVRLYNAMKRGEYIGREDGFDNRGLVDFDRKWAETAGKTNDSDDQQSSDEPSDSDDKEIVEYFDEFGRLRKGSKKQAQAEERQQRIQASAKEDQARFAAHPSMPTNIIHGDAIQHQAFNPDQVISDRMADIAKKRDRSATPPPDTHFDATAEVRIKGTGFYAFSHDTEERKKEMEELEKNRSETERIRKENEEKKDARRREIEERRKLIAERRSKAQAEKFLDEFDLDPT